MGANPLVYDGQKLIPSVTRVFSKSRDMYVFLQAYERGATTTQPLVAFVTFYRGEVKALETAPLPVTDGLDPRSKAVPLRFALPLESLATGRYDCQVTVLDPAGQKVAFWRAPVVLCRSRSTGRRRALIGVTMNSTYVGRCVHRRIGQPTSRTWMTSWAAAARTRATRNASTMAV